MDHSAENAPYPRLVRGRWVTSPLNHLALYEAQAREAGETHVAVPRDLLLRASRFRECSVREVFTSDEDGPIKPFEAECRREDGHDAPANADHVRQHSNGYYTWDVTCVIPPEVSD
jgi:hypothetical protein